jgi:hypothetical protein
MDFVWILYGFCMDFVRILYGFCRSQRIFTLFVATKKSPLK